MYLLQRAKKIGMPFFVTPYYLSLLNINEEGYNDISIRSYILYSPELVETYGHIKAWEKEDIVKDGRPNAAGWLLPEGHNIHRRYPEVAILIPDTMGRACGGLCASCQRMYDFQSERLNFEFENLRPKESWEKKLKRLMDYFETDTQLRDILITGGDALMSQNKTLRNILEAVYRMAVRKRKANKNRPEGEKYADKSRRHGHHRRKHGFGRAAEPSAARVRSLYHRAHGYPLSRTQHQHRLHRHRRAAGCDLCAFRQDRQPRRHQRQNRLLQCACR